MVGHYGFSGEQGSAKNKGLRSNAFIEEIANRREMPTPERKGERMFHVTVWVGVLEDTPF
jgi:hypothetical protein